MKSRKRFYLWQILYPVLIYYVVESVVYFFLEGAVGTSDQTYMMRQAICALAAIPFLYLMFYQKDRAVEKAVMGQPEKNGIAALITSVLGAAALGIALNNVIAYTPLVTASKSYQQASGALFAGTIWFELLGSGFIIPVAEELLFRGIVYKRLRLWLGWRSAVIFSAILFGVIHMNVVQFLYAGVLGAFLAFLLEKTGKLYAAAAGHMAANIAAILRTETGWLAFSYRRTGQGILFTCLLAVTAGMVIWYWNRRGRQTETK